MELQERLTVIVGPNGSGKSNLSRLLELARTAVESADRTSVELDSVLAMFLQARRAVLPPEGIEARVGFELTDDFERSLVVTFVKAATEAALVGNQSGFDTSSIEAWVDKQLTEQRLRHLFQGDIVVSHRGTPDATWEVAFEFEVAKRTRARHRYRWVLRGSSRDSLVALEDLERPTLHVGQLGDRMRGKAQSQQQRPTAPGGTFSLTRLLPVAQRGVICSLDLGRSPVLRASRRFTEMIGVDPRGGPEADHHFGFARVLSTILRRGLIQTSDARLLPTPSFTRTGPGLQLRPGAEANLPDFLLLLKNAPSVERLRYRDVQQRFWEFTNGRTMDVIAKPVKAPEAGRDGSGDSGIRVVPQVLVSVDTTDTAAIEPASQVPIEFAGAGAWEALTLASVLGSQAMSVVILDEPAVALHPTLQRHLRNHLRASEAQFVVITHSPYLLPLDTDQKNVQLVRFEMDAQSTRPWRVDGVLLAKLSKKLLAKGNEGLPFAWRAILCEGETDVEAVRVLAQRIGADLDGLNVAVLDCGSRDNLPDYVQLCGALGVAFLAVMDADGAKATKDPAVKRNVAAVRNAVKLAPRGQLVEFAQDIEHALDVAKKKPSLVADAMRTVPLEEGCPVEVARLAAGLRQLVESRSAK